VIVLALRNAISSGGIADTQGTLALM
jgi:hypothetical protein